MRSAIFSAALAAVLALCPVSAAAAATKRDDGPPAPEHSHWYSTNKVDDLHVGTVKVLRKRDGSLQLPVVAPETDVSPILCPLSMTVCPISPAVPRTLEEWVAQGFECVDMHEDLNSCGGCGVVDNQFDCTEIQNALGVSCEMGTCRVHSCMSGFTLALDGKRCVATA